MGDQGIQDRRSGERYVISFPIRVRWKDDSGAEVIQEGLTDNVGPQGTLVYLPRHLPSVGSKVNLTVTENPNDEVSVTAQVIRLETKRRSPAGCSSADRLSAALEKKGLGIGRIDDRRNRARSS